jgi:hypothetical protein
MDCTAFAGRTGRIAIGEQQASAVVLGTEGTGKEYRTALNIASSFGMAPTKANHAGVVVHAHVISTDCTAITFCTKNHYFGRNLDFEYDFGEAVTVTPRNYAFSFRRAGTMHRHFAIIGMAAVDNGYPLYFDGTNEKGLSIAGLNFPGNASYAEVAKGYDNVASFELISYLLGKYASVEEIATVQNRLRIVGTNFSEELTTSPLHWLISDARRSITLECTRDGMKIYDNPSIVFYHHRGSKLFFIEMYFATAFYVVYSIWAKIVVRLIVDV